MSTRWLTRLARPFAHLHGAAQAVWRLLAWLVGALLGTWEPPHWIAGMGEWIAPAGRLALRRAGVLALLAALAAGLWVTQPVWHKWWHGLVPDRIEPTKIGYQVGAPDATNIVQHAAPNPLVVTFTGNAAPLALVGKDATDIAIDPPLAGRWSWATAQQLRFDPRADWPVGQAEHVSFGAKALAPHTELAAPEFDFTTPGLVARITSAQFYQDPEQPNLRRVVYELAFSLPVEPHSLESHLRLDDGEASHGLLAIGLGAGAGEKFSVSYDALKLQATVQSQPLPIPDQTRAMQLTLSAGVHAERGGTPSAADIAQSVDVPGLYSLAVPEVSESTVNDDAGEPGHVLHVATSMPVHEREMARVVSAWLLPVSNGDQAAFAWSDPAEVTDAVLQRATPVKLEPVAGEREVNDSASFRMPQAEGGRFLFVRVAKGMKTPGGYLLPQDHLQILQVKAFAPELSIMSRGSLLALSGEKKLPLLVRDLPGVKIEIARVLPHQLHLLATNTGGDFSHPDFDRGLAADALVERFERKVPLTLKPGKTHYESVDFADYLDADKADRRGVFLLSVQGYDPKADKPKATAPDADDGTDGVGNDSPDGSDGSGSGDATAPQVDPATMHDRRLVLVTDLGLIAKKTLDGSREVYVQSIASGLPVAGASVEVWGRNGLVLVTVATDAQGHVHLPNLAAYQREKQPVLLVARKGGDLSFLPFGRADRVLDVSRFDVGGLRSAGVPNQMTAYLFSDRGLYRPGDTMHIGVIVKAGSWQTSLKDMPVEAEIVDPRGLSVRRETLRLGAGGMAELSHTTQDESPTGDYTVNLSLPRDTSPGAPEVPPLQLGTTTVKVQEFMPDRTRVALHLSHEQPEGWVAPADLQAEVAVQNLFGTPAQHRRVDGTLTLDPAVPHFASYPDYGFTDPHAAQRSAASRTQTDDLGSTQSDDGGKARFDLRLDRFAAATYQASVLVKAFEPEGGRSVTAETRQLVSDLPWLVGVKTTGGDLGYVSRGSKREAQLIAIDPHAHKTAVDGLHLVRIERRTLSVLVKVNSSGLYRYESRSKELTLDDKPLTIGAGGTSVALDTATPGDFSYLVKDAQGLVFNRVDYSVAGNANLSRSLDHDAELQVKLDKAGYQPGDDIALSIQAPYTGAGLITIERDKVYAQAWFKTDQTASVQHITLPKDFEGTGYVSVHFVRDPASDEIYTSPLSYGVAPFATSLAQRTAHITLDADKLVKPGQVVKMRLASDKPVRAVVFAVDEGILQVARYHTPDPLQYFFQKRALEVNTLQTLDMILPEFSKLMQGAAPGGDADGGLDKHLNPFKRKHDKPVAWWSGVVDVNGSHEFTYTVPDTFNGSLRVMAVAVDDDAVAAAATTTTVRGDLVLLPTLPTSMTPGDTIDVGIGVANNMAGSGKAAPVRLGLATTGGLEVVGDAQRQLAIDERGEASTVFHLRAKAGAQAVLGSASVVFTAQGAHGSARLSTDVSVRPASALVTLVQSGMLVGSGELKSQTDLYPQLATSQVSVSSTPWAFASGLMQYLQQYPFGCTEQITSQTLPSVVLASRPELAGQLARQQAGTNGGAIEPQKVLQRYLTQLRARQVDSGGIAYWPGGGADDFATVYALQLLVEARERQLAVPADIVARADTYLQSRLGSGIGSDFDWRLKAQMAYLLTRQGQQVPAALANPREALHGAPARAGDIGAAYLAAAYQLVKQDGVAAQLMQPVWDEMLQRVAQHRERTTWTLYDDPLVHDATLITLAARHFPQRLQKLPPATWEQLSRSLGQGWYNSQSSAMTILAIDAYGQAAAASAHGTVKASATDAQGHAQALALGDPDPLAEVAVPVASARLGLATGGSLPLFYAWSQSGFERNLPDTAVSHGLEVVHEVLDAKGQPITSARLGDEVTVRVRVRSLDRDPVPQVALVDLLPGGLEPVLQPASGSDDGQAQDQPSWQRRLGSGGTWSLQYADIREDRVIFFGDVTRNMAEVAYKARATNVGQFAMPAAYAEAMYDRRAFGRSAGGHFAVLPADR